MLELTDNFLNLRIFTYKFGFLASFKNGKGWCGMQPGIIHLAEWLQAAPSTWARFLPVPTAFCLEDFTHSRVSSTTGLQFLALRRQFLKWVITWPPTESVLFLEGTGHLHTGFISTDVEGQRQMEEEQPQLQCSSWGCCMFLILLWEQYED